MSKEEAARFVAERPDIVARRPSQSRSAVHPGRATRKEALNA